MMKELIRQLPPMLMGGALKEKLQVLPRYNPGIRKEDGAVRLMELSNLFQCYLPSVMTTEVYSRLYLSMVKSLQKKGTREAVIQRNLNWKVNKNPTYSPTMPGLGNGVLGGSDSFTILGNPGIGKTASIANSIRVATEGRLLETEANYSLVIPILCVETPFDSSPKQLLVEILRKVDEILDTDYYRSAVRCTADMLIGMVSQVLLNHVGVLVIDEIQNVIGRKQGANLIGLLTQLINVNSGISICFVGTLDVAPVFEQSPYLARRMMGLKYKTGLSGREFQELCQVVFSYQYVRHRTILTEQAMEWLYEHTGGNPSMLLSLIYSAQEMAILSGKEILDMETLHTAYEQRMGMVHSHIRPNIITNSQTSRQKSAQKKGTGNCQAQGKEPSDLNLFDLIMEKRITVEDMAEELKEYIPVVEVAI